MSRRRTIGVVVGRAPTAVAAEALRAAVGLTLRGAHVDVAIEPATLDACGPAGARAAATLRLFEHGVDASSTAALAADVVELWGDATSLAAPAGGGPHARLHLVRAGRTVDVAAPRDRVLHLPAAPADDASHDLLLDAILAADVVLVW
ncbi:MAG TPA: hypothetical protein VHE35_12130 [Kofleriaceae bacterium]|nr:hypothetical protein [Kofleriaceae bacterium]